MFLAKDGKLFSFSEAKTLKVPEVEKLKFQIEGISCSLLKQSALQWGDSQPTRASRNG